jgi:hypothetical protein
MTERMVLMAAMPSQPANNSNEQGVTHTLEPPAAPGQHCTMTQTPLLLLMQLVTAHCVTALKSNTTAEQLSLDAQMPA